MRGKFVLFAGAVLVLSSQAAIAQQGSTLAPAVIAAFQSNPGQLLTQFPNGGPDLVNQISGLVTTDRATFGAIITLAKNANEDQRKAIAQALAQVAKSYASGDPAFANQIQQAVAGSGLPEFAKAYAEAAGDTGTAATGGGGGGGGGGGPTASGLPTGSPTGGTTVAGDTFAGNRSSGLTGGGSLGSVSFTPGSAR